MEQSNKSKVQDSVITRDNRPCYTFCYYMFQEKRAHDTVWMIVVIVCLCITAV